MLRFIFGGSGSGKSTTLYKTVIEKSLQERDRNFLIIVPDQFTMQVQMDVVKMHPDMGIMNIDVLSFGRLTHRVFDEVGEAGLNVLDDIGKSLILRRVADQLGDKLQVIGSNMHRAGYIDEVKSTISELMQYGITPADLDKFIDKTGSKGALKAKLTDIKLLYAEFGEYIKGKYITSEETLDVLCKCLDKSELVRDSYIVFDGFTGFTPIQYKVIRKMMNIASQVNISMIIDGSLDPYDTSKGEQELFALTRKTVRDIRRLEFDQWCEEGGDYRIGFDNWLSAQHFDDIYLREVPVARLNANPEMSFLEQKLFRYPEGRYHGADETTSAIHVLSADNMKLEVANICKRIQQIVVDNNCHYRDIAVVCGNLEDYEDLFNQAAIDYDIPFYIDKTNNIRLNPLIEYIRSAYRVILYGYRYADVFHFMRCGLSDYTSEEIDLCENYVRALGIRGRNNWKNLFTRHLTPADKLSKEKAIKQEEELALINKIRQSVYDHLSIIDVTKETSVLELSKALYEFLEAADAQAKMTQYHRKFEEAGDYLRSREYSQIYAKIIALLDKCATLMGDEKMKPDEYLDILDAGFGDIELGTIPQDVDRVVVGDIERTRLREVGYLFFTGIIDGSVPGSTGTGGIISDIDRQFLVDLDTGIAMAPTPRQQMYIQRLYLYMTLTKPYRELYLSYSRVGKSGASNRPSYLIAMILRMFPDITEKHAFEGEEIIPTTNKECLDYVAGSVRDYALGQMKPDMEKRFLTICKLLGQNESVQHVMERIVDAAFIRYQDKHLSKEIARALYGTILENSVSRLENFAACCYMHFCKYGLGLDDRQEYAFEANDLGNIFHSVLEDYANEIMTRGIDWKNITEKQSDEILGQSLTKCVNTYGNTILQSSARYQHQIDRIERILSRTVKTLKYQLSKGKFTPRNVEMDFRSVGDLADIDLDLSEDEKQAIKQRMKLHGRIDRIDTYEDDDHVYVKVIDYKSGNKNFDITSVYYGLNLQLVMYMNIAQAKADNDLNKQHERKSVIPSAILYYHVDDPVVDVDEFEEDIESKIAGQLKMTGLVRKDLDVVRLLDENVASKSDVIPVSFTAKGDFAKTSNVMTGDDYKIVSEYVNQSIRKIGRRIVAGDIDVDPYEYNKSSKKLSPCTYCSYKSICGFDSRIPGTHTRKIEKMSEEDAIALMKKDLPEA